MRAVVVMAVAGVFATSNVRAADPSASTAKPDEAASAEAKKHYEEGTKAFNLAEFARAVAEFKIAYNAKPDPLLLYNIGQSFRLAGDEGQALLFYKSFLRNLPDAPNRKEVEGRIRTLEKHAAEHRLAGSNQVPSQIPNPGPGKEASVLAPPPIVVSPAPAPVTSPDVLTPRPPATSAPQARRLGTDAARPPETRLPLASSEAPTTPPAMPPVLDLGAAQPKPGESPAGRQVDLSTAPASGPAAGAESDEKPVYKKWWFWAGVAAVAVVGIAIVGNANKSPSTTLGLYQPTFK